MVRHSRGFTLVEVVIVVAIISILVAIAYPIYQNSVRKAKRVEAQAEMIELSKRMQRFKIANFSYIKIEDDEEEPMTLDDLRHSGTVPAEGIPILYDLELTDVDLATWTLIATPREGTVMADDGVICLNHRNQRFWARGVTDCDLSETSNWTGQ